MASHGLPGTDGVVRDLLETLWETATAHGGVRTKLLPPCGLMPSSRCPRRQGGGGEAYGSSGRAESVLPPSPAWANRLPILLRQALRRSNLSRTVRGLRTGSRGPPSVRGGPLRAPGLVRAPGRGLKLKHVRRPTL